MFFRPRVFLIQLTMILALGLAACGSLSGPKATPTPIKPTATPVPPTATAEPAAATVNGEVISVAEFQSELARYKASQTALGKTVTDQDANKTVLEDLIAQVLLAQGAKAAGFTLTDSALQSRIDALTTQLGGAGKLSAWESAHGYTDASFRSALTLSAEAAWMRDKIVNAVPKTADQVHVQQILLYNATDAQSVLDQLKGGADFSTLASQYDPNANGDLGWFPKGYLLDPKVEEAAFSLQVGQISDVIQTDAGYIIIKVLERDAQHPLSPDAYLVLQDSALRAWVSQQRAQATVVLAP
ncbi:MAG: peptidylprolyl isomerase [Chloroflexi bacterium]|nr:peptidylprolyl isomerase [Chloroflexota bacterium]